MSSELLLLLFIGFLQTVVQADNIKTQPAANIDEGSEVTLQTESETPARSKRWAEVDTRGGINTRYYPSSSYYYQRYQYPSNLMTLLRGRRSWPSTQSNWEVPSNLMTLLRGRRGYGQWQAPSNLMTLLRGKKDSELDDDDMLAGSDAQEEGVTDDVDDLRDSYGSDISAKRSMYLDYSPRLSGRYARPYGSRQFMVWNGGRYILG